MKQIDTPAFKRWFGRSKIVDANGKPLVVYHGTTADFTKFSDEFGPYRGGILAFFSTSPKFASDYSSFTSGSRNSNVIPVFLKIENPFDYRKDSWLAESFWDETGGITDGYSINQMVEDGDTLTKEKFVDLVKEGSWAALEAEQFVRYLKEGGYDGIVVKEGGAINYAIFEPTQAKSAYGNRGTFDPDDSDIRNPRSTPPQFPYRYAAYLKANFPEIWRAGGNIRGNDTFRWWTAYRQGDRSPTVMHWWNVTRPAWIARHYRDYRLPGVIAQIKWGTVGILGVAGMKRVVEDAIRKRYG
ncbi:MAG: hypothetical protein EBU84_02165 [Actinobacteria bacterium]|nr:hypothetical protein [Actinomycetota bacterium]